MGIKTKNKDPKTYDFAGDDIIINHKEGTLFFKSNNGLHKITPGASTGSTGGDNLGNHTATQNLDLGNNNINNTLTGSIDHIIATNIVANKSLGVFAEGTYNKYWNRKWHKFSMGVNYIIF
jgi:hypothetical protein